mgnify:CR=1 FL=1
MVFKCRSGKTSFIGKPEGTPFLFGNYKMQLQGIKIAVNNNKLVHIEPHFESVERYNPVIDKKPNEINNIYLKEDKPIFEEKIMEEMGEEESEKNILQPLVPEEKFYNAKKYQDKIFGNKFIEICPIFNTLNQKHFEYSRRKYNFNVNTILDEKLSMQCGRPTSELIH